MQKELTDVHKILKMSDIDKIKHDYLTYRIQRLKDVYPTFLRYQQTYQPQQQAQQQAITRQPSFSTNMRPGQNPNQAQRQAAPAEPAANLVKRSYPAFETR